SGRLPGGGSLRGPRPGGPLRPSRQPELGQAAALHRRRGAKGPGGRKRAMISLIYDCDNTMGVPGRDVDDGLTLLYLLGCPEVELLGVTCAFGNDTQEVVYRTTSGLLRAWGRADIPVLRGAEGPGNRASPA